jgi:hypothetical protein
MLIRGWCINTHQQPRDSRALRRKVHAAQQILEARVRAQNGWSLFGRNDLRLQFFHGKLDIDCNRWGRGEIEHVRAESGIPCHSRLPTTRPECGGGGWPVSLVQARYTAARKMLVDGTKIGVELNNR